MSGDTEWRWADPQGQQRTIRGDELLAALANGIIAPNAPVWRSGWIDWKPAHDVPELSTSAIAASSGIVPNIPPPPLFVVAAQSAFEGPASSSLRKGTEPPPPPKYVPAPVRVATPGPIGPPPSARPPAAAGSGMSTAPRSPTPRSLTPRPGVTPPLPPIGARPSGASHPPSASRGPISQRMSGSEALKRAVPSSPKLPKAPVPTPPDTQRDAAGASAPPKAQAVSAAAAKGLTVPTMLGVPRIGEQPKAPGPTNLAHTPPMPTAADRTKTDPTRATLLFDGSAPGAPSRPPRASGAAPPLVAPGVGPIEKNAVTRPPPVDTGTVQIAGGVARKKEESSEDLSDSMVISDETDPRVLPPSSRAPSSKARPSKPPPPGLKAIVTGSSRPPPLPSAATATSGPASGTLIGTPLRVPSVSSTPPLPLTAPKRAAASAPQSSREPEMDPALFGMSPIPSPGPPPADLLRQVQEAGGDIAPRPRSESATSHPDDAFARPHPPWLVKVLERFPQLRPIQKGKPIFFLPVTGGLAALVGFLVLGLLVRGCVNLVSSDKDDKRAKGRGAPSATTVATGPVPSASAVAPPAPTVDSPPKVAEVQALSCRSVGAAKTLSPKAIVGAGVEAVALGRGVGVGFATGPKEGVALELDAQSLAVLATAKARGTDIKRVTPIWDRTRLAAAADVDRAGDALAGTRTVAAANPFKIGVRAGQISWAPRSGGAATALWPYDGDTLDAVRVVPDGAGFVVAFRKSGMIFHGLIGNGMKPLGGLQETRGLGPQVGSPAIATSGGALLLMWADRATPEQSWGIRMRRAAPSAALGAPEAFAPQGGPGAPFIAPSVASLGGGRFFVVWTEGAGQSHQVRGLVVDENGQQGAPFAISPSGMNAGQAQVAFSSEGRGVAAFLASGARGFELAAIALTCEK